MDSLVKILIVEHETIIAAKISMQYFMRIHRSFLTNIIHVNEVAASYVMIAQKPFLFGSGTKEHPMQQIQTL